MAAAAHRVRRQSWRVAVRSAPDGFAVRTRVRAELESALLPEFERAFDAAAPGEAIVRIPRLELRVRVADIGELAGALREALGRELTVHTAEAPRPAAVHWHEILLAYLETGALAWHAAYRDPVETVIRLRAALEAALGTVLRSAPGVAAPFPRRVEFYFRLLQLLAEERWPEAARHLAAGAAGSPGEAASAAGPATAEAALAALRAAPDSPLPRVRLLAAVVLAAASDARAAGAELRAALAAGLELDAEASARDLAQRLATLPAPAAAFLALRAAVAPPTASPAPAGAQHAPAPQPRPEERELPRKDASRAESGSPRPFALAANCAGLVLLHPFLPRLLEGCGLYQPPDLRSLPRTAALLHWLATGREAAQEFELGFVKLLLGQRPDTPLLVEEGLLGATERDEGEALLRAVIEHWKALGNTTCDGLRVAFLQRHGALREEEDGWRLQVEPESFDVLVARLPWGLATVRLPWMTRPLYTDWPTR